MRNNKRIFTPNVTQQALEIMKKISSRPCAQPFIHFFPNIDRKTFNGDRLCLSLITDKLKNYKYKTPAEWYHDMKAIQTNCSLIFHDDEKYKVLSNQLFLRFEKEYELFVSYSTTKWSKLVGMLSHRIIFKMLKNPPKNISVPTEINAVLLQNYPFIEDCSVLPKKSIDYKKSSAGSNDLSDGDDFGGSLRLFTKEEKEQHEQNCFLTAVSALKSKDDARALVEIISEEQPKLNIEEPNPVIVFSDLDKPTIRRLIEYTKRRYIELGLNYPR